MSIPKSIIQTHSDPDIDAEYRKSWIDKHPGYDYHFFNDRDCMEFFIKTCPEFLDTYNKLPLAVQKTDLFRYAYIYHHGGIYADVDTFCHVPVHEYIELSEDFLIAGIEMTPALYRFDIHEYTANYCSPMQILQWIFVSYPGHPALKKILDRIQYSVSKLSYEDITRYSKSSRFTLELTGPVIFTNVILSHMIENDDAGIRLLQQSFWGYHPESSIEKTGLADEIKVEHFFKGSWRNPEITPVKKHNGFYRRLLSRVFEDN